MKKITTQHKWLAICGLCSWLWPPDRRRTNAMTEHVGQRTAEGFLTFRLARRI